VIGIVAAPVGAVDKARAATAMGEKKPFDIFILRFEAKVASFHLGVNWTEVPRWSYDH
jgi:hypothetical protein